MTALKYFKGDELAAKSWKDKYAAKGEITPDNTHMRLAQEFARIENKYEWDVKDSKLQLSNYGYNRPILDTSAIFNLFKEFKYIIPAGSVMAGCGTGRLVSLSNCFVIGAPDDDYDSIMMVRNQQVQLMKRRGGVGYDLSLLRPRGAKVHNAANTSTGAASFMDVCSDITNEVAQDGRRGALLLSIAIEHPDSLEFIQKKQDLTKVTGANISVKVSDEFMGAVINNEDFMQSYPVDAKFDTSLSDNIPYNTLVHVEEEGKVIGYIKKIKAKELWDKLMHCAWNTAEPGIMFNSSMHNLSPDGIYPKFRMVSTNPCGR